MTIIKKQFLKINRATAQIVGYSEYSFSAEDCPPDPTNDDPDVLVKAISEDDLGGMEMNEFLHAKKSVLVDGEFDRWEDKHTGLSCTISATPQADGSNTPLVSMNDGLPNSKFVTTSSRGVVTNSQSTGFLDGNGDGSFRVKVTDGSITTGSVTVFPDGHQDFIPVAFSFDVEASDF